jgi:hypothetical protein
MALSTFYAHRIRSNIGTDMAAPCPTCRQSIGIAQASIPSTVSLETLLDIVASELLMVSGESIRAGVTLRLGIYNQPPTAYHQSSTRGWISPIVLRLISIWSCRNASSVPIAMLLLPVSNLGVLRSVAASSTELESLLQHQFFSPCPDLKYETTGDGG